MKITGTATEDDVLTAFLQAELGMSRHAETYRQYTGRDVAAMSLAEKQEVMAARGWPDKLLFGGFPQPVEWHWAELEWGDMQHVQYIDYSYWNELSSHTRSPLVAAQNIGQGMVVYDQPNTSKQAIAQAVQDGKDFPPLILLTGDQRLFTIVEGHNRATGFALAGKVPAGQRVIVGVAADAAKWADSNKDERG